MMFKATLNGPGLLVDSLASIAELIDEGIFKITPTGISLVAADRAMVAVADFHLSKSAFEEFELDSDQGRFYYKIEDTVDVKTRISREGSLLLDVYVQASEQEDPMIAKPVEAIVEEVMAQSTLTQTSLPPAPGQAPVTHIIPQVQVAHTPVVTVG